MAVLSRATALFGVLLSLVSAVYAIQGEATYYAPPYTPSACFGNQNHGAFVAGVRDELWGNRAACGRKYRVTCIGGANGAPHPCKRGSVTVTVVDSCKPKSRCRGIINLSRDAFNAIADIPAGKVRVRIDPA